MLADSACDYRRKTIYHHSIFSQIMFFYVVSTFYGEKKQAVFKYY